MAWEIKVLFVIAAYMVLGCLYRTQLRCWVARGHGAMIKMFVPGEGERKRLVYRCWYCGTTEDVPR